MAAVREQRRQLPKPPADAARPCQRRATTKGAAGRPGPKPYPSRALLIPGTRSAQYPGGVALRFACVLRYREDKIAAEADDLVAVLALRT